MTEWATGEYRPRPAQQEGQDERDARVSRVQIYPGEVKAVEGQTVTFTAVAYDDQDSPVGGVRFEWSARDAGRDLPAHISRVGDFKARAAGTYTITAEANGRQAQVTVTVTAGERREPGRQNQGAPATRQVSSRDLPAAASAPRQKGAGRQSASARAARAPKSEKALLSHATPSAAAAPLPLPPESYYDDGNYWSADDPGNEVGTSPGGPQDDGAGSGNFQLAAAVLSLPGRKMDLTLKLAYNSRLWNKAGSEISYDIDKGWPAPGWNLGFGKMLALGINNGAMIVEPDGTRHPFTGTITFGPNQNYTDFVGHTTDGTFIDYSYHTGLNGVMTRADARYPNGMLVEYTAAGPAGIYPTRVTDAQGNFITITYVNNTGPHIQTITDTLGRVVTFHYDANNLLTAITAPGLTSGTTRTLVRLHYKQLTLNYAFSGLT
ncbi:MAG TPA: hypothetical protein VN256_21040, partial [Pyrinomonadaceae bacterium]|nr:hypothetical protein [Pyrinomonadaceae bacterium]